MTDERERRPPETAETTRDWLAERARTSSEATALVEAADGTRWSYAELDAAVEETAGRLADLGVRAGDHLGVLMETRVAFVRLVHAAMRLGAVLVPLNARLTGPELVRQAETADLNLLVCERETEADAVAVADSAASTAGLPVASVDSLDADGVAALREREPTDFDPAAWSRADPQAMLFTSGTTGDPKAVELSMSNFLSSAVASAFRLGVTPDDNWLLCLSMYHMGGLSVVLRSALYGTTVVLQEGFDAGNAADATAEFGVTGVSLVPTMLRRMLDARDSLSNSLRFVLLGGAPASEELISRCEARGVPVHPTYGMTETASQIATARPREAFAHRGTVGRPLLWTDVTVVGEGDEGDERDEESRDDEADGEGGNEIPLPAGETGELVVSGPTVMRGYYGDPAATNETFGEYGLHTGDVGYRDEAGRVWVLNRREDRIVTGGENVHPGEVVEALREHPAVRDAAVVGLADDEWGERVSALVVTEDDATLSVEALDAHCRERLAGYKCPRTVAFADELPRTTSGTVEREAVRERLREARDS
ncbi:o-succinylbenzoate--CoA ligase [Halorussus gelatinilyticus]|uniref:2-succinylbenzoate--CoA ligase n=1 Tax=Halorussus gelatinilyticus TaxID=2937524 RepID=A0A8U0IGP4_9EURY|nr:o-succinylbenzoate--CoA ligase [Halorussus gelatinilyticus]UPV99850.1 o-succinylbenzoate--CoA ligase [Halorussus gelatinilyticus]